MNEQNTIRVRAWRQRRRSDLLSRLAIVRLGFLIALYGPSFCIQAGPSQNEFFATDAYYRCDKPTCVIQTRYYHASDGSNVVAVIFANPALQSGTAAGRTTCAVSIVKVAPTTRSTHVAPWNPPGVIITNPVKAELSQEYLNVQGATDKPLRRVRFDFVNSTQHLTNQEASITGSYFDTSLWRFTSNYFQCFDLVLAPGTNQVNLHIEDSSGNIVTTNLAYLLDLNRDKTPPLISIKWPRTDCEVSGDYLTVQGMVDESTSQIEGQMVCEGATNAVRGLIERNQRFWIDHLPLVGKTNLLTIKATDVAGNTTVTNLTVIRSATLLTLDPIPPAALWQMQIKVTGKVSPSSQEVRINGKRAVVRPDGSWVAVGIPMTKEGIASFEITATPKPLGSSKEEDPELFQTVIPKESVFIQTKDALNGAALNLTEPTYKTFKLHVTGVTGKSFVLSASTNLLDWIPILTNRNSGEVFDYADTNAMDYGARFFRITPLD